MNLQDLTRDDAKEQLASALEQSRQKVAEMTSFYEDVTGSKAPASIHDYANGDWKDALSDSAKEVLEFYPPHQQKIDRKRVLTAAAAVKVIEDYENEIVKLVLTDPRQLIIGRKKTLALAEYGTRHFGEIVIQLWNVIYYAAKAFGDAVKFNLWDLITPWGVIKTTINVVRAMVKLIPELLGLVAAAMAAGAAAAFVEEVHRQWSKVSYKANVKELTRRRTVAESVARSKALPQRKGRVRRRKRAR